MLTRAVAVHDVDATEAEARDALVALFPAAGRYEVEQPGGRRLEVAFSAPVAKGGDLASIWQALFPAPGDYVVKATAVPRLAVDEATTFQEWFLERLLTESYAQRDRLREVVRRMLVAHLERHAGELNTPAAVEELEQLLFDVRQAVRWALAQPVSSRIVDRLRTHGFSEREVLDFPGLAYRLGKVEQARDLGTLTWPRILEVAREVPLTPADQAAIAYARQRAAEYLTPAVLRDGSAMQLEASAREVRLIRTLTGDALRAEMHPKAFARELYHRVEQQLGVVRDWERVARTEIQEARVRGAFAAESAARDWRGDTEVYRVVAANPCRGCLRLYLREDGMPRRYRVAELEALDALGPNQGHWSTWRPRIGACHPNGLCTPWATWVPALVRVFEPQAERTRAMLRERKVFERREVA